MRIFEGQILYEPEKKIRFDIEARQQCHAPFDPPLPAWIDAFHFHFNLDDSSIQFSKRPNTTMGFTIFPKLPFELRREIWIQAIPPPEPGVCIVWPLVLEGLQPLGVGPKPWSEDPVLPFTVDTTWPTVMHTYCEERAAVLSLGRISLRQSVEAGEMLVPYRIFDPAIDTLYWGEGQIEAMEKFLVKNEERGVPLARALRHTAICGECPQGYPAEIVRLAAVDL